MLNLKLPEELEERFNNLAAKTHRQEFLPAEALKKYLDEHEKAWLALDRLSDKNAKYYSSEEAKGTLGL